MELADGIIQDPNSYRTAGKQTKILPSMIYCGRSTEGLKQKQIQKMLTDTKKRMVKTKLALNVTNAIQMNGT